MVGAEVLTVDDNELLLIRFFDDLAFFYDLAVGNQEKFVVALGRKDESAVAGIEHRTLDVKIERAVFAAIGQHVIFFVQFAPYCPVLAVRGILERAVHFVPRAVLLAADADIPFPCPGLADKFGDPFFVDFPFHGTIVAFSPYQGMTGHKKKSSVK